MGGETLSLGISIILPTARESYGVMLGMEDTHILAPLMESLKIQTYKNFELIVVDGLYEYRKNMFEGEPFCASDNDFPIVHIPVDSNHRFWLDRKRGFAAGAMNTGIIHARGELIVKIDDCCQFGEDYLQRIWDYYSKQGLFVLSLYTKYNAGEQAYYTDEIMKMKPKYEPGKTYDEKTMVRDSRWETVHKFGTMLGHKNWFYGYSSFSTEAALLVNGFDETFDGDEYVTLVDVDMGIRLWNAGFVNKFILDKDIWVIEHCHKRISERVVAMGCGNIKCNHAIMIRNDQLNRWKANSFVFTKEDLEFIKAQTLRPPCQWKKDTFIDNCEGPLFEEWAKRNHIFNLREEREKCLNL